MKKRTFLNPIMNDTATFIETSEESKGKHSVIEVELWKSNGPPVHYHKTFSERFEVSDGTLYVQAGKEKKQIKAGEGFTIPAGMPHKFYNPTNNMVRFKLIFEPGHTGMENFIKIIYSLAADGLTDKKGIPKKFAHLATILVMSDSNATGFFTLLSPIMRMVAKKDGTEKWLLDNYCQ